MWKNTTNLVRIDIKLNFINRYLKSKEKKDLTVLKLPSPIHKKSSSYRTNIVEI